MNKNQSSHCGNVPTDPLESGFGPLWSAEHTLGTASLEDPCQKAANLEGYNIITWSQTHTQNLTFCNGRGSQLRFRLRNGAAHAELCCDKQLLRSIFPSFWTRR